MLKRDYIMRMLREFLEALALLINKKSSFSEDKFSELYSTYFKRDRRFYEENDLEAIATDMGMQTDEQTVAVKLEMLAELFYYDSQTITDSARRSNLDSKALAIFQEIDRTSDTYSADRIRKIADLEERLKE